MPARTSVEHHFAKLDPEKVTAMRRRYDEGETVMDLANEFDVAINTAYQAIAGMTWKSVPAPAVYACPTCNGRGRIKYRPDA